MTATVATDLKSNLKYYIDRVLGGESVIITRPKSRNVVMISEDEYNELQKAKNNVEYMAKLQISIDQAKRGLIVSKSMEELEALADE